MSIFETPGWENRDILSDVGSDATGEATAPTVVPKYQEVLVVPSVESAVTIVRGPAGAQGAVGPQGIQGVPGVGLVAPFTLAGVGDTIPYTINAILGQTAKLQSWQVGGVEKASIGATGGAVFADSISVGANTVYAGGFASSPSGTPVVLTSRVLNQAGGVGTIVDTQLALNIAGQKLLSIRSAGIERAYIDKDGAIFSGGTVRATNLISSSSSTPFTLRGLQSDGASAIGVLLDAPAYTTLGSKLVSIQNNSVEKAYFDKDGGIVTNPTGSLANNFKGGLLLGGGLYLGAGGIGAGIINASGGFIKTMYLQGGGADGASAVGFAFETLALYTTEGARLASFRNGITEKAYIDKDGGVVVTGVPAGTNNAVTIPANTRLMFGSGNNYIYTNGSGLYCGSAVYASGGVYANGSTVLAVTGLPNESATAVGVSIRSYTPLVTAGAKIASFQNSVTGAGNYIEKAYIDKDGLGYFAGGIKIGPYAQSVYSDVSYALRTTTARFDTSVLALAVYGSVFSNTNSGSNIGNTYQPSFTDGASAVAHQFQGTAMVTAGAKIASFRNNTVEKAYIDKDGQVFSATHFRAGPGNYGFLSSAGSSALISGLPVDGATAVGVNIDSSTALTVAGAKIASFRTNFVEKAYIDKDGGANFLGSVVTSGTFYGTALTASAATSIPVNGSVADGATAVGVILNNTVTLATAGAKLLSVRNNGTEKAYIDYVGSFVCTGNILTGTAGAVWSNKLGALSGGSSLTLLGVAADGASAVGLILDNATSLTTAGAKLASFRNATVEKAYISKDGVALSAARADVNSTLVYSASMTPNASLGGISSVQINNGTAFTVNAPTNGITGQYLSIWVSNISGGALGAATWSASYKMSAWVNPANGFNRTITFRYNGTSWFEASRTPNDVPN